jgi:phage gpG-like protein
VQCGCAASSPTRRSLSPAQRKRDKRGRKRGGVQQILLDTGLLRASYQSGPGHAETIGPLSLTVGSNLDRAAWHQFGTRTIPAREQLGWNESLIETCSEIIADHMEQQLLGGGA